jgi:hypothetical protein
MNRDVADPNSWSEATTLVEAVDTRVPESVRGKDPVTQDIESWVKQNDGGMAPYRALSLARERRGGRRVDLPSCCPHGLMPPREHGKASQPQCPSHATAAPPVATNA